MYSKDIIRILISLELMMIPSNFNFIYFSIYLDDISGQIYALMVLGVIAAEISIGLSILIVYYRLRGGINRSLILLLKGLTFNI